MVAWPRYARSVTCHRMAWSDRLSERSLTQVAWMAWILLVKQMTAAAKSSRLVKVSALAPTPWRPGYVGWPDGGHGVYAPLTCDQAAQFTACC
jgi:hypothetical protein